MPVLFEEKTWLTKMRGVLFGTVIIVLAVLFVLYLQRPSLVIRDKNAYQAVFLDNGQVYFGKLRALNDEFASLTDIYYLRAGSAVQTAGQTGTPEIDLIKLGAELHGPKDEMIMAREHVIFYEELGEGGEVMKLIRAHKQGDNQ